ncbi:hypothetical protein [Streptomyces sp. NPDC054834]
MTDTGTHTSTSSAPHTAPFVRRGRHRKPRPRKVMLAAGGLALAAGALSLVRMAPDSGVGAPGTAEAESRLDAGGTTDRSTNTAVSVGAAPTDLPSATSAMGGVSGRPTPSGAPSTTTLPASSTAVPATLPVNAPASIPTTIPTMADDQAPGTTPRPSAPNPGSAPPHAPAPAPSRSTGTPAPTPSQPGGVCVPVIRLCVNRVLR